MFCYAETFWGNIFMALDRDLLSVLVSMKSVAEMDQFFEELFTPSELADLSLRWKLLKDLYAGVPQRKISEKLGVSLCKITRGSKVLKSDNSVVLKYLKALEKESEKKKQKQDGK